MMNKKPELIHPSVGKNGMNELHFAAYGGDMEGVINAIKKDINVDSTDEGGYTALHWLCDMSATGGDRTNILSLLIAKGANINSVSLNGSTPLSLASIAGSEVGDILARKLIEAGARTAI